MGVGAGLYMCDVVKKFTFAISSPDEFLLPLGFVTAPMSLNGCQPKFARCLTVSWAGTLYYAHFRGLLPRNGILPGAIFTFRPSLAFSYIGSVTARHSITPAVGVRQTLQRGTRNDITELSQRAPPIRMGGHRVGHRPTFELIRLSCTLHTTNDFYDDDYCNNKLKETISYLLR